MTEAGLTHMLFVDALIGAGVPTECAQLATDEGLATFTGDQHNVSWAWNKRILDTLDIEELQALYTQVKQYKVVYAS